MLVSKKFLIHCIIPLLVGAMIYVFFHKPNLLLHFYLNKYFHLTNYYTHIKTYPAAIFMLNHLPDMLWAYSLGGFMILLFDNIKNRATKAAVIITIGSLTEIVQVFFPSYFTFDWFDLFFTLCALILVLYVFEKTKNN
jgi:hypothetical protein